MDDIDEIVSEFLAESRENLDRLDEDFVALERDPTQRELLARIFRTIHTIKGTCGFFGYQKLERLTHVGENLLSQLRDGKLTLDAAMTSALLRMVDAIRVMLTAIGSTGADGDDEYTELREELTALVGSAKGGVRTVAKPTINLDDPPPAKAAPPPPPPPPAEKPAGKGPKSRGSARAGAQPTTPPPQPVAAAPQPATEKPPAAEKPAGADKSEETSTRPTAAGESSDNTIRVHVALLDRLVNLVGELVLSRNQIAQTAAGRQDPILLAGAQRLSAVTSELQEGTMRMRMQPVSSIWSKFPRIARDLALELGKSVVLEMEGQDTELDRALIEAIRDPLTHLIRNAVDHGVESPEKRAAAGKPAQGRVLLRALHENGRVFIEVTDDGAGIDPAKLKSSAMAKGILTAEAAERMSDREALSLIFAPGFSTATTVTRVSGRGVGMDVVRTNIEKLGGSVDIVSEVGKGTTMRLAIPLTLAIIPALLVEDGEETFAIPQSSVQELVRIRDANGKPALDHVYGTPVYRLRGKLLPVVLLHQVLGLPIRDEAASRQGTLVVLQVDQQQLGLLVERVHDLQEIVVKPLTPELSGLSLYAGATILGTGRAALILDVADIAHRSTVMSDARALKEQRTAVADAQSATERVLLVQSPDDGRLAIPLDRVARLEDVPAETIENVGGSNVLQYRGEILPIVGLDEILEERRFTPRNPDVEPDLSRARLVVCRDQELYFGLRVDAIIDILDIPAVPQKQRSRRGTRGTSVVRDRVTELLDFEALLSYVRDAHGAAS